MPLLIIPLLYFLYKILSSLTPANEAKISNLETSFSLRIRVFLFLVKYTLGWDVIITSGLRTYAEQAALHAANPKNAAPSKTNPSSHQLGRAVDVNFRKGTVQLMKATPRAVWEASGIIKLSKLCGLRWGGTAFPTYYDPVHFDDL